MYWPPIPTAIASTTDVVTSGEGCPHAVNSRSSTCSARRERVGAEEDPREADDVERERRPSQRVAADAGRTRRARARPQRPTPWIPPQTTNVHAAPCHRPPSSIVSSRFRYVTEAALAVAAERDVEVVAQPARQRHVPAPPEVLERHRGIRRVEVLRELEAEQQRDADRDVRVAAEVGEDLNRVARRPRRAPRATNGGSGRRTPRRRCAWRGGSRSRPSGRAR